MSERRLDVRTCVAAGLAVAAVLYLAALGWAVFFGPDYLGAVLKSAPLVALGGAYLGREWFELQALERFRFGGSYVRWELGWLSLGLTLGVTGRWLFNWAEEAIWRVPLMALLLGTGVYLALWWREIVSR